MLKIFRPANHAVGIDNYCQHRAPTETDIKNHREGKKRIGFIYITRNGNCSMAAIDIDDHHKSGCINTLKYIEIAKLLKLPVTFAESARGGLHCYLRFDKYYKAEYILNYLKKIVYALNPLEAELFPKQYELRDGDTGNWLNVPYFGDQCPILDRDGTPLKYEDGIEYLKRNTVTFKQLKPLLLLSKKNFEDGRNNKLWCVARYIKSKFGIFKLEDKLKAYNIFAFDAPLTDKEISQTVLKSFNKKDYIDPDFDEPQSNQENEVVNEDVPIEDKKIILQDYCINKFRNLPIERPNFIHENLFRQKSINFIGGPKGRGKTEFSLGLSYAAVLGKNFLKWNVPEPHPVYYIDGEMDPTDIWDREIKYRERFGAPQENFFKILNYQTANKDNTLPDIKDENCHDLYIKRFEQQFKETGKKPMIFFDNLRSLSNFNENSSDEYNSINKFFLKLKAQGYTPMIIDHTGKSLSLGFRGTSGKTDNEYVCLILDPDKDKSCLKFTINFDKGRGLKPNLTEDYTIQYTFDGVWSEGVSNKQQKVNSEKVNVSEYKRQGMTQKEIAKKMGIAVGTVNRYCKELDEEDKNSNF